MGYLPSSRDCSSHRSTSRGVWLASDVAYSATVASSPTTEDSGSGRTTCQPLAIAASMADDQLSGWFCSTPKDAGTPSTSGVDATSVRSPAIRVETIPHLVQLDLGAGQPHVCSRADVAQVVRVALVGRVGPAVDQRGSGQVRWRRVDVEVHGPATIVPVRRPRLEGVGDLAVGAELLR